MNCIDSELVKNKFIGALLGTAVGDALGMPLEGLTNEYIAKNFGKVESMQDGFLPKGHYTDDTQLMIGIAEGLIEKKCFDDEFTANRFLDNFQAFRGYGPGALRVFRHLHNGKSVAEAACHIYGGGSYGNGAAMRIAPIGVLYSSKPVVLIEAADSSSRLTHTHKLGVEGAVLQAYAVGLTARTDPALSDKFDKLEFLSLLSDLAEEDYYIEKLDKIKDFFEEDEKVTDSSVITELGNSVKAHESVPTAIFCFLKHCDSLKDAVSYAVNLGGDADTIGAMTGALAGALHGVDKIPETWLNDLENNDRGRDYIRELGEKLYELHTSL